MSFERKVTIGIDFGVSNSSACYIDKQTREPVLILDDVANSEYASMLYFNDRCGNLTQFGNAVKNNPNVNDRSIIREVKRVIPMTNIIRIYSISVFLAIRLLLSAVVIVLFGLK